MESKSRRDTEAYLQQLEQKQTELLQRIEAALARIDGLPLAAVNRSGPGDPSGSGSAPAAVETRLKNLEALTQKWIRQSAATHAQVQEILRSRIWRLLSLVGGLLLRLTGGARR